MGRDTWTPRVNELRQMTNDYYANCPSTVDEGESAEYYRKALADWIFYDHPELGEDERRVVVNQIERLVEEDEGGEAA